MRMAELWEREEEKTPFTMSLFAAVTVQKNVRDKKMSETQVL